MTSLIRTLAFVGVCALAGAVVWGCSRGGRSGSGVGGAVGGGQRAGLKALDLFGSVKPLPADASAFANPTGPVRVVVIRYGERDYQLSDGAKLPDVTAAFWEGFRQTHQWMGGFRIRRSYKLWGRQGDVLHILSRGCHNLLTIELADLNAALWLLDGTGTDPFIAAMSSMPASVPASAPTMEDEPLLHLSISLNSLSNERSVGASVRVCRMQLDPGGLYVLGAASDQDVQAVRDACKAFAPQLDYFSAENGNPLPGPEMFPGPGYLARHPELAIVAETPAGTFKGQRVMELRDLVAKRQYGRFFLAENIGDVGSVSPDTWARGPGARDLSIVRYRVADAVAFLPLDRVR